MAERDSQVFLPVRERHGPWVEEVPQTVWAELREGTIPVRAAALPSREGTGSGGQPSPDLAWVPQGLGTAGLLNSEVTKSDWRPCRCRRKAKHPEKAETSPELARIIFFPLWL